MTLELEIVSEHRELLGDDAVRVFREEGGTIGRSLQNDWILPDPDRYISGRHATIDFQGGAYYLADTSSNGVYINGDCEPLGKGNPRRLFNGDTIRLGEFEITVSVDEGESLVVPVDEPDSYLTDYRNSLVEQEALKTGVQLLDEDEMTDDEAFQSALFSKRTETGISDSAENDAQSEKSARVPAAKPKSAPVAKAAPVTKTAPVAGDLIDSFLDGLGINRAELHPSTDLGELMQNAGEVLREYVEGTTQLLASRANLKNTFRLDQTSVLPAQNNPLKMSANTNDSIKQLLVGKEGEYLGPRDAVREICRDLLFHQDAFVDAMNTAFHEFADRFDPEELQEAFHDTLGTGIFSKMTNKSKYWEMYADIYPKLTEKGGGRFPQLYAEEFISAYENKIAEFRRLGDIYANLKETVALTQTDFKPPKSADPEGTDSSIADTDAVEQLPVDEKPADQAEG